MVKEEIIVKTREEFYSEIDKFELGIAFSREKHATGVVDRTQVYKITDYAPPVDTLVVDINSPVEGQIKRYSAGEIYSMGAVGVFENGATSETGSKVEYLHNWEWSDPKAAIKFLQEKAINGRTIAYFNTFLPDYENQSLMVTHKVEVTIRLVDEEPAPTFKEGEKVLVWSNNNIKVVRVLRAYTPEATHKFQTKVVGEPSLVFWRYGAKICQVCEKEECECITFKNDELVLVWNGSKETDAELRYFKSFDPNTRLPFECWREGRTSLTHSGVGPSFWWKNCVKVCQKCGKEECGC